MILLHWLALGLSKDCGYPKWPVLIVIPQNTFMFVLFSDFYYKEYIRKPKLKEIADAKEKSE
jgi:hypothetical protein